MKRRQAGKRALVVVPSLALVWLIIALVVLPAAAQGPQPEATVRYVTPGGDCGGSTPCYASIRAAVDAVGFSSTDEIRVAQGTYTGVSARTGITQVVYLSRTVTIRDGYAIN